MRVVPPQGSHPARPAQARRVPRPPAPSNGPPKGFSGPSGDPDGDGFTNLEEYRQGTDPRNAASHLAVASFSLSALRWTARPYELYLVEHSEDLLNWSVLGSALAHPTSPGASTDALATAGQTREFFQVRLAP